MNIIQLIDSENINTYIFETKYFVRSVISTIINNKTYDIEYAVCVHKIDESDPIIIDIWISQNESGIDFELTNELKEELKEIFLYNLQN